MPSDPSRLRKKIRKARQSLPWTACHHAAESARSILVTQPAFYRSRRVALYMAAEREREMDPWAILETALAMGKQCYLPVIPRGLMPRSVTRLLFQRFDPRQDRLAINRYGILEPTFRPRRLISPQMLDLVLTPLVAFDRNGNRIGMGAGFYDRTFAGIGSRWWHRPRLLGLAYAFQEVEAIEARPWDVSLDGILTEREIVWTRVR